MDFRDKLIEVYNKYNIVCSDRQIDMFCIYRDMLVDWNTRINLTAIIDDEGIIYKHFLDSVLPYGNIPDNINIIDIGTGAGFPSIPLLIMNNKLNFTMVDSVDKKLNFVRAVLDRLGLTANVVHSRIEDLAHNVDYREKYDIVVSRALSNLSTLLEYSIPFVAVGGKALCYKGVGYQDEIDSCTNTMKVLACKVQSVYEYHIDELDTNRYVIDIVKTGSTGSKYPRGMNKPKLKPLN